MATIPDLKVLFFDVFGTCVMQRKPVADTLHNATQQSLKSTSSMSAEVRDRATTITYEEWDEFGRQWDIEEDKLKKKMIQEYDNVDFKAVDKNRIAVLPKLLAERGLIIPAENNPTSEFKVGEGSLFDEVQLQEIGTIWHRLPPWSDTCQGLDLLDTKFDTVALSNTYSDLLQGLVTHGEIPFTQAYSADMFDSYKPNPKVYLGAAEKMGYKPEECALVAAHLGDLKAAKACGFYAIYVERPKEDRTLELKGEGIPDLVVTEDENGMIALAKHLGIEAGP